MGNRLSRIYTRTGDAGTTGLADGSRVPKQDLRIAACGDVDELNCAIGLILAEADVRDDLREMLTEVQHDLFDIGAELSLPAYESVTGADIARLEAALDRINADLPPLEEFILPQGRRSASACHLARAVCRRAERTVWTLAEKHPLRASVPAYLNRLSDLLFVIARALARAAGGTETSWHREPRQRRDG